jgi:hypothetical protein
MDDDARRALQWLTELVLPTPDAAVWCLCGHDLDQHASEDDNASIRPCRFPIDGPVRLCRCLLFTPAGEEVE